MRVSSSHPLVELLLLLGEDTGDLLGELNKVAHLCQLLTDPTDTGGKRAAAGHAVGQLTLWMDRLKGARETEEERDHEFYITDPTFFVLLSSFHECQGQQRPLSLI